MKKIAIFQENLTVGGIQKSLINLLNNLDYSKVSVDCYVVNDVNFYTEGISKKVKLKKGRRFETSSMEIKDSTINLPQDDIDFINDFIYFMMYEKGNIEYTRMEFFKELVSEIEKKYNI